IRRAYYDATQGQLEDRGLSKVVHGVKFTKQKNVALAQGLERYVLGNPDLDEPRLILLGPSTSRQVNSIVRVNRKLKATTSRAGDHGDAFWSNAMAVEAAEDGPGGRWMAEARLGTGAQVRSGKERRMISFAKRHRRTDSPTC